MIDRATLESALMEHKTDWHTAQEWAELIRQPDDWKSVRDELDSRWLQFMRPGHDSASTPIADFSCPMAVKRLDLDGATYRSFLGMDASAWASVVSSYVEASLVTRPSEARHLLAQARQAIDHLQQCLEA